MPRKPGFQHSKETREKMRQSALERQKHLPHRRVVEIHGIPYVMVRIDNQEVFEHRYLVSQHLGRKLKRSELVHHINGDSTDNRIENLQIVTASEHAAIHHPKGYKPKRTKGRPPITEEARRKLVASHTGKSPSEETRRKLSEAMRQYHKRRRAEQL